MQYHNLCALRVQQAESCTPMQAYARARTHVVRVWHLIIRNDLLPRFLHPVIADMEEGQLSAVWMLDEPTLLFGLFRAFHALPLAAYQFADGALRNLGDLMKSDYQRSRAEKEWEVDWDLFFGAVPGGSHSGISASVAEQLRMGTKLVALLDLASAKEVVPMKGHHPKVREMIDALPGDWPDRITGEGWNGGLAQDFAAAHPHAPVRPEAQEIASGPLYQFLMIEAQCHGERGGFGPLGSALLRASVAGSMARVRPGADSPALAKLETPKTMLELINLVRRTTE
jgi:hypothetical protein